MSPRILLRQWQIWTLYLSLVLSKLGLCSVNHMAGYFSNLARNWLSIFWAYSEQEAENGPSTYILCLKIDDHLTTLSCHLISIVTGQNVTKRNFDNQSVDGSKRQKINCRQIETLTNRGLAVRYLSLSTLWPVTILITSHDMNSRVLKIAARRFVQQFVQANKFMG